MDTLSTRDFIRAFPSARDLDSRDLKELIGACEVVELIEDSILFDSGDASDSFFLMLEGQVRIEKMVEDGRIIPLGLLARGHIVGDMGVIDGQPRAASAVVVEDLQSLELSRERYTSFCKNGHPVALWLLQEVERRMTERISGMYDRIARLRGEPELADTLAADEPVPHPWYQRWFRKTFRR